MSILTVNIHIGNDSSSDELKLLKRKVERLERHMSVFDDELGQLNDVTNQVADRVQNLIDQVGQLTGSQATAAQAAADQLVPFVEHLRAIGTDPNQPVPPAPDVPPIDDGTGTTDGGTTDGGSTSVDGAPSARRGR
jgi:hypothetical protein